MGKNNVAKKVKEFGLIAASETPVFLDPELATKPLMVALKFGQNVASKIITNLLEDYRDRVKTGESKDKNFTTDRPQMTLFELLKYIQENVPDEDLMRAMRSIFFVAVSKNATQQDELLAYEFLQTVKNLSGIEVLILKANYKISKNQSAVDGSLGEIWAREIAKEMGFGYSSMVEKYEGNLMTLKLISQRTMNDNAGIRQTQHYRLTDYGYKLCEFITNY